MSAGDQQWVIRVRIPRANSWPSQPMTRDRAIEALNQFQRLVEQVGDSYGFVEFEAFSGRVVRLRAREVLSVEIDHWKMRHDEPETAGQAAATLTVHPAAAVEDASPTGFLRRQTQAARR